MSHYSVFITGPEVPGDYGTNSKCVFDGKSDSKMIRLIAEKEKHPGVKVQVFRGKQIGRFYFEL